MKSKAKVVVVGGGVVGVNFGMVAGVVSVVTAAYLMYQMGWRDDDDDY